MLDGAIRTLFLQADTGVIPMTESDSSTSNQQVTTGFLDQTQGTLVDFSPVQDPNMLADYQPTAELGKFLSRPQLIYTHVWNETDAAGSTWTVNPWNAFFSSTSTKKKLDNYAFINCTLKVKVVINASPFYFGSQLVSYQPMAGYYTPSVTPTTGTAWIVSFSQMPHIWVYPQTSQGGELKLPFFYHKNWLPLTNSDTTNFGLLTGITVNQLASANGVSGSGVTIQVWAWAEDVKLLGPTLQLAIQSDEYEEENHTGMVSRPASSVASIASRLTNLPVIGPFARATQIGASAVAGIASLFGFSNPPVIAAPHAMVPRPFPQFASPDISTPVEKLSLDPKQELTVDPRIAGLDGTDELLLRNLVTRESYLTSASISTITAVDTVVFNTLVTPNMWDILYNTVNTIYPTPIDHFTRLFQYWRGDIIFRFRVICTPYHKGRIRISYDPAYDIVANVPDYTSVFNQVVDIGETVDVELRVPYMQAYAWLRTHQETTFTAPLWNNSSTLHVPADYSMDNGMIALRVVTPITAPVASSTIFVQVFVRAADNFCLAGPVDLPNASFMTVQSDLSYSDTTQIVAGTVPGSDEDTKYLINMGECVTSVRQLLRRTNFSYCSVLVSTVNTNFACEHLEYQTIYPPWYGYDPNGRHTAKGTYVPGTNFSFNFVTSSTFTWIGRAFVGMRGSMTWHYNVDTTGTDKVLGSVKVLRNFNPINTGNYYEDNVLTTAISYDKVAAFYAARPGSSGTSLTNQNTCTSVQVVVPDYNHARFHWVDPASGSLGQAADGSAYQNFCLQLQLMPSASTKTVDNIRIDKYYAIGPDFTFFFFLCAPPWANLPQPTPA